MFDTLLNWIQDTFARNDVLDGDFVTTDLTDADGEYYEARREQHWEYSHSTSDNCDG